MAFLQTPEATHEGDRKNGGKKREMRAPFSFLKPTSHSEKKATNALAHRSRMPPLKTKKKIRTPSPQIKTNSEPHRMASTMAATPQVVTIDGERREKSGFL